jgi:hypothetical protein
VGIKLGLFEIVKKNIDEVKKLKPVEEKLVSKMSYSVVRGQDNIFTKHFNMALTLDGKVVVNGRHRVKVINCSEYSETTITKSASRKIAGAMAGGMVTGGVGAIVGSIAFGNNKKKVDKYSKLIAVDENGYTHEIIINANSLQRALIKTVFID